MKQQVTGIILAGGKSSRMGFDKGLMKINGRHCIEHIAEALLEVTKNVIVISNNDAYKFLGLPIYKDLVKEKGPIGGIYSGLTHSDSEKNLVVACDMPFVTGELLQFILDNVDYFEIAAPVFEKEIQPLCAYYLKHTSKNLKNLIDNRIWKMKEVLQFFHYKKIPMNNYAEMLANVNTSEELKQIQKEKVYAY